MDHQGGISSGTRSVYLIWLCIAAFFGHTYISLEANASRPLIIGPITIAGNNITRDFIILRELPFRQHDTIPAGLLGNLLQQARDNVYNTKLFNNVSITVDSSVAGHSLAVNVSVVERWYIWPIPYIQPADRNINVWVASHDFSRVTVGADLTFKNMRGRREVLVLPVHFGYNLQIGAGYQFPFINRARTIGLQISGNASFTHEVAVKSSGNKPVFMHNPGRYLQQTLSVLSSVTFRPGIHESYQFIPEYLHYHFANGPDTVTGFLMKPGSNLSLVTLSLLFKHDHRDVQFYPLQGYYFDFMFRHTFPFDLAHNSYIRSVSKIYYKFSERYSAAASGSCKISFVKKQPYIFQQGLGYGNDYVRGYEHYVIDGQHFVLFKMQGRYALVPWHYTTIPGIRSPKFNIFPWAIYLSVFSDIGYVRQYPESMQPNMIPNSLNNKWLSGYGIGVDFTSYYDVVIRLETTLNSIGETGLFIHFVSPI